MLLNEQLARALAALVGLACIAVGGSLAWHYPIAPAFAIAGFVLWTAISYRWPFAWLLAVPALLPVTEFATWTGWFTFEELDLWVLGAAGGGYARRARDPLPHVHPGTKTSWRPSFLAVALVALFAVSCAVSLYRGVVDAGGLQFDWIGSYASAMNSVRLGKGFAMALLLWPLLQSALANDERRALDLLTGGIAAGLGAASLVALWERAAFADLLNFSSEYRTTALFWEMHVGGAAIDGFLALTVPFIVWVLWQKRSALRIGLACCVAALAAYACLTTFSRGVYVAVPGGLATLVLLLIAQRRIVRNKTRHVSGSRVALLTIVASLALYLVFREGGYRALLAFIATVAVALWLSPVVIAASFRQLAIALTGGLTAGVVIGAIATLVPKGPYVAFALALALNLALSFWPSRPHPKRYAGARLFAFVLLAVMAATVALHWGGIMAFVENAIALLLLTGLAILDASSKRPWIPRDPPSRALSLGLVCLLACAVPVFVGGAYMAERFSTTSGDLELRFQHWKDGVRMLRTNADWWLGKGLGRFPANYFFSAPGNRFPGSFSLHADGGERYLKLSGPRYSTSWGDLFRMAQRVPPSPGAYKAFFEVRAAKDIVLHFEICEQHLLYNGACGVAPVEVGAGPTWQRLSVAIDGRGLSGGPWFAPRLAFFAMAVESNGGTVDIRDVSLLGPDGMELLANGNFTHGTARWISISDSYHWPWHIENLALNVLFDQGIVGLGIFAVLVSLALWRVAFGAARRHPVAPFLAASLVGFIVVGVFGSVLDFPRLAFLFYLLLLTSLGLSAPEPAALPQID